jgi:hypothetical protein
VSRTQYVYAIVVVVLAFLIVRTLSSDELAAEGDSDTVSQLSA